MASNRWRGLVALAIAGLLSAAQAKLPVPIERDFRTAGVPSNAVALYVREVGREAPLIDHRATVAMNPASTMKIVTTLVGLDVLSPQFTWKTDFLAFGPLRDGVLDGGLAVRGSGDPKFTWEHLHAAIKQLRAQGIRDIRGELLLDKSAFAPASYDAAAFDGQPLRAYNVPPDALLFNFKTVGFKFSPQPNGEVAINVEGPAPDGLTIANSIRTVGGPCADWRSKIAPTFEVNDPLATASFKGVYPSDCGDREWYVSVFDHSTLFANTFARMWRDAGGSWSGRAREGVTPRTARVLYTHSSSPLASMVADINKFSNNVMARQLLLSFDAQLNGPPARVSRAAVAIGEWSKLRGFEVPELVVENGAGLSRKERISAKSLARFLEYGLTAPFATDFVKSLPVAANDGTLARRFVNSPMQGSAFLKTGTLTGVKSLAGYLSLTGGRRFLFVGMINHANADTAVEALDRAVEWVFTNAK